MFVMSRWQALGKADGAEVNLNNKLTIFDARQILFKLKVKVFPYVTNYLKL